MLKRMLIGAAIALTAGCATVELSSPGSMQNGERLLVIQNDGYELFGFLPLGSGALDWSSKGAGRVITGTAMFSNRSDTRHLYSMAIKVAERENCDLKDVVFIDNTDMVNLSRCYGLVFYDDVAISAVLVPRKK